MEVNKAKYSSLFNNILMEWAHLCSLIYLSLSKKYHALQINKIVFYKKKIVREQRNLVRRLIPIMKKHFFSMNDAHIVPVG